MRKSVLLTASLIICMMAAFTSCKKENKVTPTPTPSEGPFKLSELKYKGKVHIMAANITAELSEALNYRLPNQTSLEECQTIVVTNSLLDASKGTIIEAARNGKTVVVAHPKYESIKKLMDDVGEPMFATDQIDSCLFFGFNKRHAMYSMSDRDLYPVFEVELTPEQLEECEEAYNEWLVVGGGEDEKEVTFERKRYPIVYYLDGFVKWLNEQDESLTKEKSLNSDGEPHPIKGTFNPWHYTLENERNVVWTIYKYGQAKSDGGDSKYKEDNCAKTSATVQVYVVFSIYPAYAFNGQGGSGDYYFVKTSLNTPNENVYAGYHNEEFWGTHCHWDGPCMTDLNYSCMVIDGNDSTTGRVPFFTEGYPKPGTTEGSTTYTTGFSYDIGGSATGGYSTEKGGQGCATFNFGLGWSDSESETVPDIKIHALANSGDGKAAWKYEFTNVIKYKSGSSFTTGSTICVSTAEFGQSWGWYSKGTADCTNNSLGQLYVVTNPNYGCAWYLAQGSGRFTDMPGPTFYNRLDLVVPNRYPTGQLIIDIPHGLFVSDISIINESTQEEVSFSGQTFDSNSGFSCWLDTGSYTITLMAGASASTMKLYKYKAAGSGIEEATITRGNDYRINAAIDFEVIPAK